MKKTKVKKANTSQCKKCLYRSRIANKGEAFFCTYILLTGHSRPCEPSPNCTVFKPYNRKEREILNKKFGVLECISGKGVGNG